MPVVAVAGGTGGVGKTIVDVLTQEAKHQVVVLTRKTRESDAVLNRVKQIEVDYSDVASLTQILEAHKVHTVISALSLFEDEHSVSQLNLIRAAEDAPSTRRFIPSEYSFIQTEDLVPIDPSIKYFLDAANQLKGSKTLQFTRVVPGFFMDYWGMPHVRTNIKPMTFGVHMQSCEAVIPGDGNDVICMTYTYDMAVFMARLLEVEHWEEFSVVVGDEVTFNQLVEAGERIRGRKFKVVYDSVEKVKEGDVNVPPQPEGHGYSQQELVETTAFVDILIIEKVFNFPAAIRSSQFSDLKLVKIEEFLRNAWEGRA